jgi:dynein assembly factor 2
LSTSYDIWDNNIIFQIELESDISCFTYKSPTDNTDFERIYNLAESISSHNNANDKEDELFVQIEELEEKINETISIEIKNDGSPSPPVSEDIKANDAKKPKKANRRKLKNRSMSESFCDSLKVISENEVPELAQPAGVDIQNRVRKYRSVSECFPSEENPAIEVITQKLKSILKRSSLSRSVSCCSSDAYSCSIEHSDGSFISLIDHNCLSESCKKSVRFNDTIKKQIFR